MNREIYDRAFNILTTQSNMCAKLEDIGLRFEYGDGFVGKALESLINDSESIIIAALGLHEVSVSRQVNIFGTIYPTDDAALYTDDNDPEWSITMDDFCEFFYHAIRNEATRELMWEAMANKNIDAKSKYNALGHGRIGSVPNN
jgi:hypothetical protein